MLVGDYSARSLAVNLRTYSRKLPGGKLERIEDCNHRSHRVHHERIADTVGRKIHPGELDELEALGLMRQSWVAGRTRFLGGTDYAFSRAASQFNCSFLTVSTVYDVVDAAWLLLNGCGVGFRPQVGTLRGFDRPIRLEANGTTKGPYEKGRPDNQTFLGGGFLGIQVGDSSQAWAKAIGKLFMIAPGVDVIRFDCSECRGPGGVISGYGWICNGPRPLIDAVTKIVAILNSKAGCLLDEIDIIDVVNLIGTILSSRRSAQIALLDAGNPRADEFAGMKERYWEGGNDHRRQSNNTLQFWHKPSRKKIEDVLRYADECGGDPGIENASAARNRAPWFQGTNPCHEILLPPYGFCNLVTNCLPRFGRNFSGLMRAVHLIARANYRQTCVDLRDGILQPAWHQTQETLRLCGVSLTGCEQARWLTDYQIRQLRNVAVAGAYSQADEWGMPRPAAVTTLKPEGTGSKAFGSDVLGEVTEGIGRPLGRYILNWINFSAFDPLLPHFEASGYRVIPSPADKDNVLVCFPVEYRNVPFDRVDGKEVNLESAVDQFKRYIRWQNLWADHAVSATISYSPEELPDLAYMMDQYWDDGFIAVSVLRRNDPTKTAKDLGHPYLPQEVTTREVFHEYESSLRPLDVSELYESTEDSEAMYTVDVEECKGGVCPVR